MLWRWLAWLGLASAWSPAGHERLNDIAQRLLHGKHRDQIRTMMHSDVVNIGNWESVMDDKYPETKVLHWHHQEPEWACGQRDVQKTDHIRCDGHGAKRGSLFCALAFFFEHFADEMLLKEYPAPKTPIGTPKAISAFAKVDIEDLGDGKKNRSNQKAAFYLRWLATLVGDLHQPLHWLAEKQYGEEVKLQFRGQEYSLLKFWEDGFCQRTCRTFRTSPLWIWNTRPSTTSGGTTCLRSSSDSGLGRCQTRCVTTSTAPCT
ncbi:unnamed protein product [Effrenium voratum]|nr:unnamed protein product [Effrenium voratum]